MYKHVFTTDELRVAGLKVMGILLRIVLRQLTSDLEGSLDEVIIGRRRKKALAIDAFAERAFLGELHKYKDYKTKKFSTIRLYGEEGFKKSDLNLSRESGVLVLVDPIDGSDLLERGLFNWCSAAVFFKPDQPDGEKILAVFVGLPSGEIYCATNEKKKRPFVIRKGIPLTPVDGPSKIKKLKKASICFYGQKASSFMSAIDVKKDVSIIHLLNSLTCGIIRKKKRAAGFRIYNLAGIPMMVKLADHRVKDAHGIDAVIELNGQKAHDVVAGAYIAKKAGATLTDLNGDEISYIRLEELLLHPVTDKLTYVLTSTKSLNKEIVASMKKP